MNRISIPRFGLGLGTASALLYLGCVLIVLVCHTKPPSGCSIASCTASMYGPSCGGTFFGMLDLGRSHANLYEVAFWADLLEFHGYEAFSVGIGRAACLRLAADGASVAVTDIQDDSELVVDGGYTAQMGRLETSYRAPRCRYVAEQQTGRDQEQEPEQDGS